MSRQQFHIQRDIIKFHFTDIWIVGSSIIHWAKARALKTERRHLSLDRLGVNILWIGQRGLKFDGLKHLLYSELATKAAPRYIIFHVGGNDIISCNLKTFTGVIRKDVDELAAFVPDTTLIWSDILPRRNWGDGIELDEIKRLEIKRKRINRLVRKQVAVWGGKFIAHPEITHSNRSLYFNDGIHLSDWGNDIFLNVVQGALEMFIIYPDTQCFPELIE